MIALINCGGSGSRLWPLSTPEYPKHLLVIDGEDSLLQETYKRTKKFIDEVYFITEAGHAQQVKDQLPEVDDDHIIIEPARRGTASCLLMALHHIQQRHDASIPLIFMHADHIIRDIEAFQQSVEHAAGTSDYNKAITLLGVEPTSPEVGFGYIHKGEHVSATGDKDVYRVKEFKEKPDFTQAVNYIHTGNYLWNMGYFAAPLQVFIDTMERDATKLHRDYKLLCESDDVHKAYLQLEDDAIDYALIEKATNLLVVPGTFDWVDVGSYQDLHKVLVQDEQGNAIKGDNIATIDVTNSLVQNNTSNKVGVIGLDNIAVVVTDDGIVITNRNMSQKVKEVSKQLKKK